MAEPATPSRRRRRPPASAPTTPTAAKRRRVRPVFIVCPARSGSTLLRYLLDTHPDIVSPPELNLSSLLQHAAQTWQNANEAVMAPREPADAPAATMSPEAYRWAKKVVDEIMVRCARPAGASVFVDKSLPTVDQFPTVSACYPKAHYIFLYRYPLDMIASGIEASRWGFNAFGFTPYVGSTPGNFVAGLANYWIDKVSKMLEFERSCSVAHARIYYELLCDEPAATTAALLDFLDLPADETLVQRVFEADHGRGPGDYKIDFTHAIDPGSIGRGSTLPELLTPEQVTRIDDLLAQLDYPSLQAVRRGDLRALLGLKSAPPDTDDNDHMARLLIDRLTNGDGRKRPKERPETVSFEVLLRGGGGEDKLVIIDDNGSVSLGDPFATGDDRRTRPRVCCAGDVLLQVAAGDLNLAQAVHDGRVRVEVDGTVGAARQHPTRGVLTALSTALRARRPGRRATPPD